MTDLYEILGVARTATAEEIKAAHRRRAMETHPDRGGSRDDFERVQKAFEVLSDPMRRAAHDRTGDPDPHPMRDEAMAVAMVTELVLDVVKHLTDYRLDPVKVMAETMDTNIGIEMRRGEAMIREKVSCEAMLKRFRSKGRSRVILTIIETRIGELTSQMLESRRQVDRMKRAKEMILDHEFKVDDLIAGPESNSDKSSWPGTVRFTWG